MKLYPFVMGLSTLCTFPSWIPTASQITFYANSLFMYIVKGHGIGRQISCYAMMYYVTLFCPLEYSHASRCDIELDGDALLLCSSLPQGWRHSCHLPFALSHTSRPLALCCLPNSHGQCCQNGACCCQVGIQFLKMTDSSSGALICYVSIFDTGSLQACSTNTLATPWSTVTDTCCNRACGLCQIYFKIKKSSSTLDMKNTANKSSAGLC